MDGSTAATAAGDSTAHGSMMAAIASRKTRAFVGMETLIFLHRERSDTVRGEARTTFNGM
jgi:hypothetical protein